MTCTDLLLPLLERMKLIPEIAALLKAGVEWSNEINLENILMGLIGCCLAVYESIYSFSKPGIV